MKKGNDGNFHTDIEAVAKTILTNKIVRAEFAAFIDKAYSGAIQGTRAAAAGFIGRDVAAFLKKNAGIDIGDSVTISLQARLLNGPKAVRHGIAGNAVGSGGAHTILDALLYGQVYYESATGNLIYLFPHSANNLTKITVNPRLKIEGRSSNIWGPGIVNVQTIPNTPEKGDYRRILIDLQKVK
ncbi:MAG: hypothetical protein Pg6A_05270 [Termitinemataceae bacterium]|nr:MAG: hypothetical protein Pg6A_05270 [Termitinemataceae bacterium]